MSPPGLNCYTGLRWTGERSMDWKKKVLLIGAVLAAAAFVWLQFFGAEQPM